MNRSIRAKIKINSVREDYNTAQIPDNAGEKTGEQISARAVYSEDKTTENYSFSVATPSLSLLMYINNPNAFGILKEGLEYYLDFVPVEDLEPNRRNPVSDEIMDSLQRAAHRVFQEIQDDEAYRVAWKANIAMAFVDEVARHRKNTGRKHISNKEIHTIANTAADNFLTLLTR